MVLASKSSCLTARGKASPAQLDCLLSSKTSTAQSQACLETLVGDQGTGPVTPVRLMKEQMSHKHWTCRAASDWA